VLAFIIAAGGGTSVFTSLAAAGLPVAAASAGGVTKYGGMAANYAGRKGFKYVAPKVLRHRIILNYEGQADEIDTNHIIDEILKKVPIL
jgi:hypothetical protein